MQISFKNRNDKVEFNDQISESFLIPKEVLSIL